MHIEPGLVDASKIVLSYATAATAVAAGVFHMRKDITQSGGTMFVARSIVAMIAVIIFFEVLPHFPVGVSEVHLILGSSLLLMLGTGPAAVGLGLGLLIQGVFVSPFDLPQYGMNLTTLLAPLFVIHAIASKSLAGRGYTSLGYAEVFKLSLVYQGGIVAWVAFWAIYGQGVGAANIQAIAAFGASYMLVVLIEPLADLALLFVAKKLKSGALRRLLNPMVYA
ncbi:energy-coupling factor ABC transporter permease [Pseudotabrizicola sp. 4114]|uniref:energy-coupling factor ABC transporter permease n=1 Tax=Pseudotabrizicola sp. 4114 TaxID=2817731 RepID=UPI002857376E|nr:hypothetical protein [Pseudorhodobacter sp. 4114]